MTRYQYVWVSGFVEAWIVVETFWRVRFCSTQLPKIGSWGYAIEACERVDQHWHAEPEDTTQKDEKRRFVGKEADSTQQQPLSDCLLRNNG